MPVTVRQHNPEAILSLVEKAVGTGPAQQVTKPVVCIGDVIESESQEGYLRGHGTQVVNGQILATVCGVVERVNKLVYVRPLKSRYSAETGDVVVGRVSEILGKKWKVDLNSRQEAGLLLSAVNLPGGVQRRRTAEDELNMRTVFKEGDLISAEVQAINQDGNIALHTRSFKYGKLVGGQLISVAPNLVKRQKQHFHHLEAFGVDLVLGINGLLWVAPHFTRPDDGTAPQVPAFTKQQIESSCRVANAIRALARLYLSIYPTTIVDTIELALEHDVAIKDMLGGEFLESVCRNEAQRRHEDAARGAR